MAAILPDGSKRYIYETLIAFPNQRAFPKITIVADDEGPFDTDKRSVLVTIPEMATAFVSMSNPHGHIKVKRANIYPNHNHERRYSGKKYVSIGQGRRHHRLPNTFDPKAQLQTPHHAGESKGRQFWVFRNLVYSTTASLSAEQVKALLMQSENKLKARVAHAVAIAQHVAEVEMAAREPIPDDVKMFVWQRDQGQCVKCKSRSKLEFDHIIPVTMGGGGTARNIQLLCETCNRAKGGSLA